jgi:hypothetical protein
VLPKRDSLPGLVRLTAMLGARCAKRGNVSAPSTDVIRRVFDEGGEHFIEVGPWPDAPDVLELRTVEGKYSAEHWGPLNVTLSPAMAAELGRALLAASGERA